MLDYAFSVRLILQQNLRQHARLQVLKGYIAARRHLLKTGSLTRTWDLLVPEYLAAIPEDPFTKAPVKFRGSGNTLSIYSVGANGLDEGGEGEFSSWQAGGGDIGLVLQRKRGIERDPLF